MDDNEHSALGDHIPILFVLALLMTAAVGWCFLSSCLGTPARRYGENLWELMRLGAESDATPSARSLGRRRGGLMQDDEMFEMDTRRARM